MRRALVLTLLMTPSLAQAQAASNNPTIAPNQQRGVHTIDSPFQRSGNNLPSPDLLKLDGASPPAQSSPQEKPAWLKTVPFGKSSSSVSQPVPNGPHAAQAVPVQGVDAIEMREPAAPSNTPLEADPATEDPATPTEETAPIFSEENAKRPQHIVFRALNKVTGRASLIEAAPEEPVRFGKLNIHVATCQISDPNSQRDDAGFFDITEQLPDGQPKPLFSGWMYATSPSITSLEHPIYDVTMVECVTDNPARDAKKKAMEATAPADTDATDARVLD